DSRRAGQSTEGPLHPAVAAASAGVTRLLARVSARRMALPQSEAQRTDPAWHGATRFLQRHAPRRPATWSWHPHPTPLLRHASPRSCVDLRTIQFLLGHKNLQTTSLYLHVTEKQLTPLRSPFDLLRLPKPEEVPPPSPATPAEPAPSQS